MLTAQFLLRPKRKSIVLNRLMYLTVFFILYNITYLILGQNIFSERVEGYMVSLNALFVGIYSAVIALSAMKPSSSWLIRAPLFLITIAVAFGLNGVFEIIIDDATKLSEFLTWGTPIVAMCCLIGVLLVNNYKNLGTLALSVTLFLFSGIVVISYFQYFDNSKLTEVIVLNSVFLAFSSSQMFRAYSFGLDQDPQASDHDVLAEYDLTKSQIAITKLILTGKSYTEIAEERHVEYKTVSKHASNIFEKVGVKSKEELIAKLRKNQ